MKGVGLVVFVKTATIPNMPSYSSYRFYVCELDTLHLRTNCYRVDAADTVPRVTDLPTRLVPVPTILPRFMDSWHIRWSFVWNWKYSIENPLHKHSD